MVAQSAGLLNALCRYRSPPGGWLLLEHGHDQQEAVQSLLQAAGFNAITTLHDYAGHPRITEARNPAKA